MDNKEVVVPLHSPRTLVFNFFIGFFRAMAHVFVRLWIHILLLNPYPVFFWTSWCALGCKELSFKL